MSYRTGRIRACVGIGRCVRSSRRDKIVNLTVTENKGYQRGKESDKNNHDCRLAVPISRSSRFCSYLRKHQSMPLADSWPTFNQDIEESVSYWWVWGSHVESLCWPCSIEMLRYWVSYERSPYHWHIRVHYRSATVSHFLWLLQQHFVCWYAEIQKLSRNIMS